ncbi:MAG: hypothetical protein WBB76_12505 [Gaiellaceae bacterium]
MSPIYWKPKYGTRSSRHKAWVRQQARREAALKRKPGRGWLRRLLGLRK